MKNKLTEKSIAKIHLDSVPGQRIIYRPTLSSTFDEIRRHAPEDGLTVVCSRQSAGSGRLGRKWESPVGGIYLTFLLLPPFNGFEPTFVTTLCALAVCRALSKYVPCLIKWPNDIVSGGKKLCGILTRSSATGDKTHSLLVGIGINANIDSFPKELCHATSIKLICGLEADENAILEDVLCHIQDLYNNYTPKQILEAYTQRCANLQKEVTIHYPSTGKDVSGICTDILPDGSMNVKTRDGVINVNSGEVSVKGIYD